MGTSRPWSSPWSEAEASRTGFPFRGSESGGRGRRPRSPSTSSMWACSGAAYVRFCGNGPYSGRRWEDRGAPASALGSFRPRARPAHPRIVLAYFFNSRRAPAPRHQPPTATAPGDSPPTSSLLSRNPRPTLASTPRPLNRAIVFGRPVTLAHPAGAWGLGALSVPWIVVAILLTVAVPGRLYMP